MKQQNRRCKGQTINNNRQIKVQSNKIYNQVTIFPIEINYNYILRYANHLMITAREIRKQTTPYNHQQQWPLKLETKITHAKKQIQIELKVKQAFRQQAQT